MVRYTHRSWWVSVSGNEGQSDDMECSVQWKTSRSNGASSLVQRVWGYQRTRFCSSNFSNKEF